MKTVDVQGLQIPALGLGTWQVKGGECERTVAAALEIGYRHIDTAQAYENEEAVGAALRISGVDRGDIFLATKVWFDRLDRDGVLQSTDASLRRLDTDYVDLLMVHWPTEDVSLEETLGAFLTLKDQGRIRGIGVSNFTPSQAERAARLAPIACNQIEYHPLLSQDENLELARSFGYAITAYAPLARGEIFDEPKLKEIGERHGKSASQVCLRWLLQQPNVVAIPKSSQLSHLRQNFDVFDFELGDDEMQAISALARGERLIDPDWAPAWGT